MSGSTIYSPFMLSGFGVRNHLLWRLSESTFIKIIFLEARRNPGYYHHQNSLLHPFYFQNSWEVWPSYSNTELWALLITFRYVFSSLFSSFLNQWMKTSFKILIHILQLFAPLHLHADLVIEIASKIHHTKSYFESSSYVQKNY